MLSHNQSIVQGLFFSSSVAVGKTTFNQAGICPLVGVGEAASKNCEEKHNWGGSREFGQTL